MNLLNETLRKMEEYGKTVKDVEQVTWEVIPKQVELNDRKPVFESETRWCTWETFAEAARAIEYDNGFGSQEIGESLEILFKDGAWMQRWEYDGSGRKKNEANKLFDLNNFDEWFALTYIPMNCGGFAVPKQITFKEHIRILKEKDNEYARLLNEYNNLVDNYNKLQKTYCEVT